MPSATTTTFRGIERTGALEARVREIAQRLRHNHDRITQCHLTVYGGLDGSEGAPYAVRIHLSAPGAQIHADSLHHNGTGHRDVYVALRDAYASAARQLQDLRRERRSSLVNRARSMVGVAERSQHHQRSKS